MRISLDTNVWMFGLFASDISCKRIVNNLSLFDVVIPSQVRTELERNLPDSYLKRFYQIVNHTQIELN